MKLALTAVLMLTLNQAALAETQANAGAFDDIEYGPPETAPAKPAKIKAMGQTRIAPPMDIKPAVQPAPTVVVEAKPTNVPAMPVVKAQATVSGEGCPEAVASPDASKTPVEVWVDQEKQTITIRSPDLKVDLVDKVSTGGGLKIPSAKSKRNPYCARTPKIDRIVSAVKVEDFANTKCTDKEKRDRSTVFPMYYSGLFSDKNDQPVPMPKAIRIDDEGRFFHVVPPSYKGLMGHNVSGECVRLFEPTAVFLQAQINKYGSIKVHISEPPNVDRQMPQYCDEQMVAQAKLDRQNGRIAPSTQATGSEGVVGGEQSAQNIFAKIDLDPFGLFKKGGIFNPDRQAVQQRPKANIPERRG